LRGAAGVSVALPFLESLPERSAWSSEASPVFSLFICAANGVVQPRFFPSALGPLTENDLATSATATAELARHADKLLFLKGLNYPVGGPTGCSHAQGSSIAFTARPASGAANMAMASGPSVDMVIAEHVQPGVDPLTLYAGNKRNGYIAERLSFDTDGRVRVAEDNPYLLYARLVGIAAPDGSMTPEGEAAAQLLAESRQSVHDFVKDELNALMNHSRIGSEDKRRLQQHVESIRDIEITMGGMAERCTLSGLDITALEALETGFAFTTDGMIEDLVKLHMSLVATAFACNFNRTATLQWGDGTDNTRYAVASNAELGNWPFHHISHRIQSDAATGTSELAEQAHAEIDVVRMQSLAAGLDHFAARGLADHSVVMWTNHIADGPSHSFRNLPTMLWGSAGGYLKQGAYIDLGGTTTNKLFNTLITAAVRDTGVTVDDFGEGTPGPIDAIIA
jgi:hypothetical protein